MHEFLHTPVIMSLLFIICPQSHTTGTTARQDPTAAFMGTALLDAFAEDGMSGRFVEVFKSLRIGIISHTLQELYPPFPRWRQTNENLIILFIL